MSDLFQKYETILQKHNLSAYRNWKIDKTLVMTVQKPKKIVTAQTHKQVKAMRSTERGTLAPPACAVFMFPWIHYPNLFFQSESSDCIGAVENSGLMAENDCVKLIENFIQQAKTTEPVRLLNNHNFHVNIKIVRKVKEHHITMLSLHCSHKLQPLGVGAYGRFRKLCSQISNFISGFRATGLWPLNLTSFFNFKDQTSTQSVTKKKANRAGRKRKSAILTDTPEAKEFEEIIIKKQKQDAKDKKGTESAEVKQIRIKL